MGENFDISHLTLSEQKCILQVLQRNEDLQRNYNQRITRMRAELQWLKKRGALKPTGNTNISSSSSNISSSSGTTLIDPTKTCNRCRTQLGRIINRGAPCRLCQLKVCKSCRFYIDGAATQWICVVCNKHREIEAASGGWMNYFGRSRSTERAFTTSVDDSTRVAQRQANYRNWRERVSTSAPATQSESHESVMVTRTQLSPVSRSPSHGSQLQQSPRRSGLPSVLPDPSVIERIPSPSSPRSVSPLSRDYLSSAVQRTPSLSPLTVSPTYKIRSRDTSPLSLSRSPQGTPTHPPPPPLIQTRSPSPAPRSPASRSRSHSSEGPHSPSPLAKKTSFGFETSAINNATSMSSKSDHGRHKSSSSGAKVFLFPSSKDQRLLMELIEGKTQKNLSVPKSGRDESDSGSSSAATSPSTSNLRLADYSPTPMSPKTPSSPRTPLSPSLLPYESQENSQQSRSASNYSMYSCNDLSVDGPKSPIPPPRRRASPLRKQKAVTEAPPTLPHYPRSDSSGKESIWPPDRSVRKLSNVSDSGFAESIGTCSAPLSPRSRQQSRQSSKSSSYNAQSKSPTPRTSVQSMGTMDSMSSLSEFENEKPPPPPPLVVFRKVTLKKKNKPPEPPTSPKIIQDDVFGVGRIEATGSIPFVPKIGGAQSLPRLNTNNYSVPFSDTNVNLELTSSLSTLTPNTAKFSTSVNNSENNNQRKRKRLALTRYLGALTNSVLSQSASLPSLLPNHGSYDLSKFTPPIEELLEPVRMLNKRPVLTEDGVGSPSSSVDVEPMTKLASLKKRFKVRFRKKGPAPKPPTPVLCDDVSECSRFAIDEDQLSLKSNLQVSMVAIHSQGSVDPFDRFGPIPQDEDLNSVQNDDLRSVGGFETPTFSDGSLNIDSLSLDTQSEININFGKMMPESDDYRLVFISSSGSSKSSGLDQLADSTEQNIDQILETPSYNRISTTLRRCEIGDGSIFWEDSDWEFHSDIDDYEPCGSDLELVPFVGKSTSLVHIPGQFQHEEVPPPSTIGFDPEDKRSLSPLINRLSVNDGVEQQNSAINCCEECQKDQLESSPSPCDDVLEEKSNPENICEEERQFRTLSVGDSSFQGERIVNISCKTGYDVLSHVVAEGHNQEEEGANFTEINRSVIESEQSPLGILSYESADFSGDFRANESSNRVLDGVNKEAVHLGTIGSKEDDYDLDILEFLRALFEETSDDEDVTSAEVVDPQPIRYARVDENGIVMCELSREDEEMSENENLDSERHFDDDRTMEGNSSEPTSSKYPTTDGEDEPTDEDLQTIDVGCSDVEDEAPSSILEEYFTFALESDSSGSQLDSGRSTKQPAVKLKKSSVEEPIAVVNDPTDGEDCDAYDSSSEEDVEQPYSSFYGHQDHYLHTIVEESCEESDKSGSPSPRTESPETSELEKYFSFAISGLEEDKGGGGSNRPLSFLSECSDCSSQFSTASSVYGDDDLQNDRTSSDLASSRLENYFMSGLVASKLGVNSYPDDVEFMTTDDSEYLTSDGEDVFFANSRRNSGSFFSSVENFDFFKIHSPVSLKSDSSDDSDISQTDAPFDRSDGFDTVKRKKKSRKIQNTLPPEVNFDELRQVVALDTIFSSYDVQKPKRSISGQHNGKLQNFSTDVKDVVNYLLDATCSSFVKSLPIEDISTDSQLVLISASPELAKENNLTVVTDLLDDLIDKICNDNDVYQTPIPDLPCNDVIYSDFANKLASNVLTTVFEGLQKMNFLKFLSSYCDNTINKFLFAEVEKIKMFDNFANELSVDLIDQAFHDVRHLESFSSDIAKSIMNSSLDVENFRNSRIENNVTMKCPAKSNEISKLPVNSVIVELDDQSVVISELLSEICGKVCEMEQEESNIATKERKSSTNSEDEAIFIFNKVLSHINGMSASSKGQSQDSSQLNFLESQIKQLMETVSPFASVAGSVTSEEVSSCTSSTLETSSFSSEYGSDTDTLESSDVEECATPECVTPTPTEALPDAEPSKCSFEAMEIYQQVLSSLSKIRAGIPENKEEVRPCEKDNGDSFSKDYISNQIKMLMMSVNSSNASSPSSTPEMKHIGIVSHSSHCSELDSDLVAGMRIRKGPRSVDSRSSQDTRAETCSETCSIVSTSSISFEVEDSEGTTESDDPKPSECDVILSIIDDLAKEGKDVLAGDSNEQGFLPYYSENGHNFQELGSSSVMQGLGAFRGTHNRPDMYIPKSRSKESFDAIMQVKSSLEIQKSSESLSDIPEESENSQSDDDEGDCVKRLSVILVDDGSNKVRESIRDSTTSLSSKDSRNTRDSSTSLSSSKESFVTVISPSDPPPTRRYLSKSDSHSYPALPVSRKYTYDHDLHKYYATKSHSTFQIDSEGSMKPRRRARKTGAVKQALADLISPHHHKKYSTQMWVESIQTRHKDIANDGTNPGLAKMLNSKEKASSENNLLAAIPSDSSPVIATKSTGHIPDLTLGKQGFRDTGYYSLKSSGESIPSIGVSSSSASSMSDHISSSRTQEVSMALSMQNIPESHNSRTNTLPPQRTALSCAESFSSPNIPSDVYSSSSSKSTTLPIKSRLSKYGPPNARSSYRAFLSAVGLVGRLKSSLFRSHDNSKSSSKPAISSLAAQENNSSEGSVPQINVSEYTERSLSNANPEEDVEQAFTAYRHRSRTSLSSFGARSESMTSVYSAAGGGRYGTVTVTGEILFKLSYNYKAGTMEIHIMECRDLAPVDIKRNRSDPYVKVYLLPDKTKGGKRKTKVKKHTLNPQFDEVLKFHVTISELETRTLWLTVWHSDMFGRNDFLGEVMMSLGYEIFDKQDPKWYALQERIESLESPLTYKGDIIVAIKFIPPDLSSSKRSKRCDLNNPKGELHVLVKEARNLMATRANGTSDPFCKSYLLPEKSKSFKQKTPVIKKNCNPAWNYTFVYESTLEELKGRCLELTIWDYDKITSNDFLGGVRLSLGTGKYHDRNVDWMDSQNEEVRIWQDMLDHPNQWTDGSLLLRPSMQKQL